MTLVIFYLLTTVLGSMVHGTFSALGSTLGAAGRTVASAATGIAQATAAGGLEAQLRREVAPDSGSPRQLGSGAAGQRAVGPLRPAP